MPSIFDVAKQAGVSPSTVSRTFNSPHLINDKTKERVLAAAERVNYRPLSVRVPRETRARKSGAYGFHFFAERPEDTLQGNAFYSQVVAGALAEASALGLRLVLSTSGRHDVTAPMPPLVRSGSVSGMLLVGAADPKLAERFIAKVDNIIFVDTHGPTMREDCVVSDNFGGAFDAVSYLIGLGHERIGFVRGKEEIESFNERIYGYVSAQFKAGLHIDSSYVVAKEHEAIRTLLRRRDRPTAIMGANDECAIVVMQVCYEEGLSIPKDLSLVGFDDTQFSARVIPPLTSMHVPTEMLGRLGVRRLYARSVENADPSLNVLPACTRVPVTFVERASCRSIR
jgi:LacI family transcriptional regulator